MSARRRRSSRRIRTRRANHGSSFPTAPFQSALWRTRGHSKCSSNGDCLHDLPGRKARRRDRRRRDVMQRVLPAAGHPQADCGESDYGFGGPRLLPSSVGIGSKCRMIVLMILIGLKSPPLSRSRAKSGTEVLSRPVMSSVATIRRMNLLRSGHEAGVFRLLVGGRAPVQEVVIGKGRLLPCLIRQGQKK